MKRFIAIALMFLSISSACAFCPSEKRHEISFGYGRFSLMHLNETLFHNDSEDGLWYVDEEKKFYGTFSASYLRQTKNQRLKFGVLFTYEGYKTIKTAESVPSWLQIDLSYYEEKLKNKSLSQDIKEEYEAKVEQEKKKIENFKRTADKLSGEERDNTFTFEPILKVTIARTEKFAFYQRYGLGLCIDKETTVDKEKNYNVYPAFTISPACFEFGNNKLRGFVEILSFSYQGVFNGGLIYQF